MHYNVANSYLFVNDTEIHKIQEKGSKIVSVRLCLGNIWKEFSTTNMEKAGWFDLFMNLVFIMILLQLVTYKIFTSI